MTPEFLACFPTSYRRFGNFGNTKTDYARCCARVVDGYHAFQCKRANGHGPHGAYCKQHDPVAAAAKREAKHSEWKAKWAVEERQSAFARDCKSAIREIAAGHNDPRALAQSIIAKLEAIE